MPAANAFSITSVILESAGTIKFYMMRGKTV